MGLLIGSLVPARGAVAVVNLVYLPMSVLSGLWFPITMFPEVMQRSALVLPAFHLGDLALTIVGLRQANVPLALAVLVGSGVLFLLLALAVQRRRAR
jgi:ABC-2 type transport system permease protein